MENAFFCRVSVLPSAGVELGKIIGSASSFTILIEKARTRPYFVMLHYRSHMKTAPIEMQMLPTYHTDTPIFDLGN
jgi:hypothetical protein